jgi:exopolysaccharide production protein ExoZ
MSRKSLSNIQMLRAFAALNVILFHAIQNAGINHFISASPTTPWQHWGASGVDIFFVISGFIMVYIQHANHYSPKRFLMNRVARIIPLYWIVLLTLLFFHFVIPVAFRNTLFTLPWITTSFLMCAQFSIHAPPILSNGWTLEFEMLFYILFSCALFTKSLSRAIPLSMILIALFALISGFYFMIEFIFGMIVGMIYLNKKPSLRVSAITFCIGVLSYCLSTISGIHDFSTDVILSYGICRALVWGMPAAFIVFGLVNLPQYENRVLQRLGDASYSIYLFQFFAILPFYSILQHYHASQKYAAVYVILCFLLTSLLGYILYFKLEKNITQLAKKMFFRKKIIVKTNQITSEITTL